MYLISIQNKPSKTSLLLHKLHNLLLMINLSNHNIQNLMNSGLNANQCNLNLANEVQFYQKLLGFQYLYKIFNASMDYYDCWWREIVNNFQLYKQRHIEIKVNNFIHQNIYHWTELLLRIRQCQTKSIWVRETLLDDYIILCILAQTFIGLPSLLYFLENRW